MLPTNPAGFGWLQLLRFSLTFAVVISIPGAAARAQELSFLLGGIAERDIGEESYTWEIEYLHGLGENFAASFSWINEGHVPDHHRDGHSVRLWARTNVLDRRLSLLAGLGSYRFFDTNKTDSADGFSDLHGWGLIGTLGARWYTDGPWLLHARLNVIDTLHNIDTWSATVGVGYQLERPKSRGPVVAPTPQPEKTSGRELTVFVGRTIVNSLASEKGIAACVEFRQGLRQHLDGTLSLIHEGDAELIRRNGLAGQLWLTRAFFGDRLTLGVGAGFYLSIDEYHAAAPDEGSKHVFSGLVTMSVGYRVAESWIVRYSWNRVVSDYDRDTDVLLLGLGRRF